MPKLARTTSASAQHTTRIAKQWESLRPASAAKARQRLQRLAESLERNQFHFPAAAIRAYLSGLARSLDEAFGLTRRAKRGRPRVGEAVARKVFELRSREPPAPWTGKSPDALDARFDMDERSLRELYDRYWMKLVRERIEREWAGNETSSRSRTRTKKAGA